MLDLVKIAVTGGLACGKTTVCGLFKERGAYVVDADAVVHKLLSPHTSIGQQIIALLGEEILTKGQIDRAKIANIVFNHPPLLNSVQKMIHPAVKVEIETEYEKLKNKGRYPLFVAEVPLLFESGADTFFDFIIAVVSDLKTAFKRFEKRKTFSSSKDAYQKIMQQQLPLEEKIKRADCVIDNSGDLTQLRMIVENIYQKLSQGGSCKTPSITLN